MPITDRSRYSRVAIWLHWLIGLVIIGNLIGGLTLDLFLDSADLAMKALGFTIIGLHKSLGLTVIVLTLVRIGWRLANPPPPLPSHMTRAETLLARGTHLAFYVLMLAMPLSGWAMVSTGKTLWPIPWFGLFNVPHLPLPRSLGGLFSESHELLGWLTIALIVLHILAGLKHQILDRDDLLARMLPFLRRRAG
ncbi:MAG: cytochrome b [Polymorphobacter sp.]